MFRRHERRDEGPVSKAREEEAPDEELDKPEGDYAGSEADTEADELEPTETVEDEPEDVTADLESQAADYLADNDVWMYGPNAEDVLAVLDRLEDLTPVEARPVAEAWLAIPKSDREKARKALRKILETDLELGRHYQMAREAVGTWLAVKAAFPEFQAAAPDWPKVAGQASEAALDAATALILDERIEEADYQTFSGPWFEAMDKIQMEEDLAKLEGIDQEAGPGEEEDEESEAKDEEAELEFGPNSDAVTDFLNRLWLLTPDQIGRLVSSWKDADRDELHAAHESLQALVDADSEYRDQVRKAQAKLAPWLNTTRFEDSTGLIGQSGQGESRKMAGPALADAAAALVLGDLLEPEDADTLYRCWFNVIGAPLLPASDELGEGDDEDGATEETDEGTQKS